MTAVSIVSQALPDETLPVVSGCVAFGTTLALSTLAQKMIGVTTGTRAVSSMVGMITVCAASLASQRVAAGSYMWLEDKNCFRNPEARKRLIFGSEKKVDVIKIYGTNLRVSKQDMRV